MKKSDLKVYILQLSLIIILFFALFASNIFNRIVLSIVIFVFMFVCAYLLKRRKANSIYKRQTILLMIVFAAVYIGVFYLLGLYFGFTKARILLSSWSLLNYIIPISIIVVSSEYIRRVFLSQDVKIKIKSMKLNLSLGLTYVSMVLVDLLIYTGVYDLTNLDDFLVALGFVLFASLSCNLLYNYISIRFGSKSVIIYRLITILFMYIIPVTPDVYIFFRSFLRMLYPYIIYLVLEKTYAKTNQIVAYSEKKRDIIGNTVLLVVMVLLIMLISCQFKYGIIVIGSESMTGTVNKGDAIIYESYDSQEIMNGQVIMFDYNGMQTIHRVVDIRQVNGQYRYYTQGDANKHLDNDYVTNDEIYGLVKLRIKYIGYPTLWLRELFK